MQNNAVDNMEIIKCLDNNQMLVQVVQIWYCGSAQIFPFIVRGPTSCTAGLHDPPDIYYLNNSFQMFNEHETDT